MAQRITTQQIVKAIKANRAGHENSSAEGLLRLWELLTLDEQTKYLNSIKENKSDAIRTGTE